MNKLFIAAVMAVAVMGMTSCGNSTPKPNLKTDVDTLSYAMGLSQTQGLKEYLVQMDIDTTYIDAFVKGLNEGANAGDDKKKAAYFAGVTSVSRSATAWSRASTTRSSVKILPRPSL